MKSIRIAVCLAVVCMMAASVQAADFNLNGNQHKDVTSYYSNGILCDSSSADVLLNGCIFEAYLNNNSTLNILEDGEVEFHYAYNDSTVNISGGTVVYPYTYDNSTVNISGGSVSQSYAYDNSTVNVSGGMVKWWLSTYENSFANISGGYVGGFKSYENSTAVISGGDVTYLNAYDLRLNGPQRINITGGLVEDLRPWIMLEGNEHLNYATDFSISDLASYGIQAAPGTVNTLSPVVFTARGTSSIDISGGRPELLYAYDSSTTHISSGSVAILNACDLRLNGPQRVNITGGTVKRLSPSILLEGNEHLNYATDFSISDLTSYGIQAAPGTVGTISAVSFTTRGTSSLDISGGNPDGSVHNYDNSTVSISGGNVDEIFGYDNSTINISGGNVHEIFGYDNSTVNISGGEYLDYLEAYGNTIANISGGNLNTLQFLDDSIANISGGSMEMLWTHDNSIANISSGSIKALYAFKSSTVNISGGSVGSLLYTTDNSIVNISGGSLGWIQASNSTVSISGGSVEYIEAYSDSTVIFDGYDFTLGQGLSWDIDGQTILGTGTLIGKWFDDTSWEITINWNNPTATIMAIPEPATLLLVGFGGLVLQKRKRKV